MSKITEGLAEALAFTKGEEPAARLYVNGHYYVPEGQWQPIETAPKDGKTFVDLWADGERVVCCVFRNGKWVTWGLEGMDLPGWEDIDPPPTHWRPLPAPPST